MKNNNKAFALLILAAIVFFVLSIVPLGNYVQWPFVIITTFIHEMGHGLTALAVGGDLIKVEIYQNASGLAWTRTTPGWRQGAVAAGGLLAPSIAGAIFIFAGRTKRASSMVLLSLSIVMLISCAIWVRSFTGLVILITMGILFLVLSSKTNGRVHQFLVQFMGVHMLVDTFTRTLSYLFSGSANVAGQVHQSDASAMAEHLIGGHWFWACVVALSASLIFFFSLRLSYMKQ